MHIPVLSLVALFGATQGLLLSTVLLSMQAGNLLANRLLAGFLFAESMRLFLLMFTYDDFTLTSHWWYLLLNITFVIGPLLFSYVQAMTNPTFKLAPKHTLHLIPAAISTLLHLVLFYDFDINSYSPGQQEHVVIYVWGITMAIVGFASLFIYSLLSARLLTPYSLLIKEQFSAIEKINLRWLKLLIYFCMATAIVSSLVEFTRLSTDINVGPRVLASLVMSVMMIYGVGIMGIRQPAILGLGEWQYPKGPEKKPREVPETPNDSAPTETPSFKPAGKYQKSGLTQQESSILWDKLLNHMECKHPYLENGLKLSELADSMDLLPNHLSQIINTHAQKSFFDFINHYRIEAAKKLLLGPETQHLAIAGIALEAGFNSQNTFYNQFKKYTNTTPAKFRKQSKNGLPSH